MGNTLFSQVKSLFVSLIVILITSLLSYAVSNFMNENTLGSAEIPKHLNLNVTLTQYEANVLQGLVNPDDIIEDFNSVGGLSDIKEDILMNPILVLPTPT